MIISIHPYIGNGYYHFISSVHGIFVFTARCYSDRGIASASRLSVCLPVRLSMTLRYPSIMIT